MKRLLIPLLFASGVALAAEPALPPPVLPPPPLPKAGLLSIPEVPVSELRTYGTGIPLAEFLRITLGEMAHRPYLLTPDAASAGQFVAADLTRFKKRDPLPLVREVLAGLGFGMRDIEGVLFVERRHEADKPKPPQDLYVYQPKHRAVGSLASYFSMFPSLTFSYASGIATRTPLPDAAPTVGGAGPGGDPAAAGSSLSTGATTYSQTNKDPSFLVVKGPAVDLAAFKSFLAQVDIPVPEVVLRAYVFEVRDAENRDSAVSLVLNLLDGKLGVSLGATSSAGDALRLSLPNITLAVNALTGDSRVRLVSSPVLRAADGTTASATIGTDTPTLGSIVSSNGSTQQSVSYQSAGVLLSVSPRILEDSIRLTVSQELSSFVKTDTGLADTPTKLRRAFKSDLIAKNGEALLLGGLSETQQSEAKQGNFLWFGSSSKSSSSSEIVVLLKVERL